MAKFSKYLISTFLIFGLTVNDCFIYSQINSLNYHQVSNIYRGKEFSRKHSGIYVYTKQIFSKTSTFFELTIYRILRDIHSAQIQVVLQLQIELYQKIYSMKAQHFFLNKIVTSSNHYSSLYKA